MFTMSFESFSYRMHHSQPPSHLCLTSLEISSPMLLNLKPFRFNTSYHWWHYQHIKFTFLDFNQFYVLNKRQIYFISRFEAGIEIDTFQVTTFNLVMNFLFLNFNFTHFDYLAPHLNYDLLNLIAGYSAQIGVSLMVEFPTPFGSISLHADLLTY